VILSHVPTLGWSAEKHARKLIALGMMHPRENASEVEATKKFIRDLRRRGRNPFPGLKMNPDGILEVKGT